MKRPTCWRCEEPIDIYYSLDSSYDVYRVRWTATEARRVPETFLCADCTDEIAELSAP